MNASAATWLFDLGNSRLKGACLHDGAPGQPFALAWPETKAASQARFDAALRAQLARWPAPERVLIASVVAASRADHLRALLEAWPAVPVQWLRSPRRRCGITNRYRVPERLGIDRFLAMAAAHAAARGAAVVIGCGTALTLDAVDARGMQQEGMIAPSPQLMLRSLRAATAIDAANPDAFAAADSDDTARALQRGCARAAMALVSWYHARQRENLGDAPLWLHGGGAEFLRGLLDGETAAQAKVLEDAVLRGLVLWAESGKHGSRARFHPESS